MKDDNVIDVKTIPKAAPNKDGGTGQTLKPHLSIHSPDDVEGPQGAHFCTPGHEWAERSVSAAAPDIVHCCPCCIIGTGPSPIYRHIHFSTRRSWLVKLLRATSEETLFTIIIHSYLSLAHNLIPPPLFLHDFSPLSIHPYRGRTFKNYVN